MNRLLVPSKLWSRAQSLSELGLEELAWHPEDAFQLLRLIHQEEIAVLGGDVYLKRAGRLEPSHENWYAERDAEESLSAFASRSQTIAFENCVRLTAPAAVERWVVLVLSAPMEPAEDSGSENARMERNETVSLFNRLYLGDSLLQKVELVTGEAEARLIFNAGKRLKTQGGSIFEPEAAFAPAVLLLQGVRSISCEGSSYQLNSTVVGFGAGPCDDDPYIDFWFELTGGTDPEAFMVKMKVVAKGFTFGHDDKNASSESAGH